MPRKKPYPVEDKYCLFIGNHYPRESGLPLPIDRVWHDLLSENNEDRVSQDVLSSALHSSRDLARHANLVKLRNLCRRWSSQPELTVDNILFTVTELDAARIESGINPDFFKKRSIISTRHREALILVRLIGEGNEADEWTQGLREAAMSIADARNHTAATLFLRKHKYVWDRDTCTYTPKTELRNLLIENNKDRVINWVGKEAGNE